MKEVGVGKKKKEPNEEGEDKDRKTDEARGRKQTTYEDRGRQGNIERKIKIENGNIKTNQTKIKAHRSMK